MSLSILFASVLLWWWLNTWYILRCSTKNWFLYSIITFYWTQTKCNHVWPGVYIFHLIISPTQKEVFSSPFFFERLRKLRLWEFESHSYWAFSKSWLMDSDSQLQSQCSLDIPSVRSFITWWTVKWKEKKLP